MDAVDAEARANASRVALALEGLISGLGAGANKQARVLTANLANNRGLRWELLSGVKEPSVVKEPSGSQRLSI